MTKIYKQHDKAFQHVSAYVVTDNAGNRIATVAFKFPRDGAGRLWCYVHFIGLEMVRDYAGGYGYDKRSAAVTYAVGKIPEYYIAPDSLEWEIAHKQDIDARANAFKAALADIGGKDWDAALRDAGFNVLQAV